MSRTLGASEVAVALGLGRRREDGEPYVSQRMLWSRLTGRIERYDVDPDNVDAEIGKWGEAAVANRFLSEQHTPMAFGAGPLLGQPPLTHPRWPWLHARPDLIAYNQGSPWYPVELKNPRELDDDRWGESGTDQLPDEYLVQVIAQVAVMGAPFGILAAMARAPRRNKRVWAVYRYDRNEAQEASVLGLAHEWYQKHVVGGVAPPVDGSQSTTEALNRSWKPRAVTRFASREVEQICRRLRQVKTAIDQQESHETLLTQQIKDAMGEAEVLRGIDGTLATWRANKNGDRVFRLVVNEEG